MSDFPLVYTEAQASLKLMCRSIPVPGPFIDVLKPRQKYPGVVYPLKFYRVQSSRNLNVGAVWIIKQENYSFGWLKTVLYLWKSSSYRTAQRSPRTKPQCQFFARQNGTTWKDSLGPYVEPTDRNVVVAAYSQCFVNGKENDGGREIVAVKLDVITGEGIWIYQVREEKTVEGYE